MSTIHTLFAIENESFCTEIVQYVLTISTWARRMKNCSRRLNTTDDKIRDRAGW